MLVSELTAGKQLDSLVALAQGWTLWAEGVPYSTWSEFDATPYQPSTNGAQAFELLKENSRIALFTSQNNVDALYYDNNGNHHFKTFHYKTNSEISEAICKAFLVGEFEGDEIPDEIMARVE